MQHHKSQRHVNAANARWRAADVRAQAERDAGIPDREQPTDHRQPVSLDLSSYGGPRLRIEPRLGYVAARAIDADTGRVQEIADAMGQSPGGNQRRIFYGLIDKGYIRIMYGVPRGIVVLGTKQAQQTRRERTP